MPRLAVLLSVLAVACSAPAPGAATGAPAAQRAQPVVITEAASGGTLAAAVGQLVRIELPATPGTGYAWEIVAGDPRLLAPEGESVFVSAPPPNGDPAPRIGGPGLQVLQLRAKAAGTAHLQLHRRRSFEPGAPPDRTFTVAVNVR